MTTYRFVYPDYGVNPSEYAGADPMAWHRQHNGQIVTVVRRLRSPQEYDWEGDALFVVRSEDGQEAKVWHSELHSTEFPWPSTHDKSGNKVCPP